ncbi:hypothetical protein SAMN06295885_3078 [Rathayibacter oskolensis]|uniref:Uncharacterized protein n=1 Tax=Rathayibacter oskolensis TaxID=1891671 RepID=A0A1X7PDE7_9MICO|nr:hypothetical protein [Rathayibacter oskolensis]SMH48633.1 hypothetical protein SAMN06295885_3078 [Rathayibacter oskolensis]
MQAEDDERRDLERALYARPSGDAGSETRRREAVRRLRAAADGAGADGASGADAEATDGAPTRERSTPLPAVPTPAEPARRTTARIALIAAGALLGGLVLGAVASSFALDDRAVTAPTGSPSPTARPADRFEELVAGWEATTDLPTGLSLITAGAEVYSTQFLTPEGDRLLLAAPNGTTICLALGRADGTFSAGCTGLRAFFDGGSLEVVGTGSGGESPAYTRVALRPDGSLEGGFQFVGGSAP